MISRELDLLQGTLDVLVLRALSWGPMHGYAVARFIRDGSDEAFRILDGALYTSLHRMEERRWVESEWGTSDNNRKARFYTLTADGRKQLDREAEKFAHLTRAVQAVMRTV